MNKYMNPEDPYRVLMTADTLGGVWTYAIELARAFEGRAEILLAAMGGMASVEQRREAEEAGIILRNKPFQLEWMDDPWDDVIAAGGWLLDLEDEFAPDIIHLNNFAHGALAWRAPVLVVGHSCVCSWWEAVHKEPAPEWWGRYRMAVSRGLHAASAVVAPTRSMLNELEKNYGVMKNGKVISNGVDVSAYGPGKKQNYIFSAGRLWDLGKNVRLLAEVSSRLPWPVYIAGDAMSPDGRETEIQNLRFLGRLTRRETSKWMARATIYAMPARYEPFGLSALEAALHGCALVLGDIASLHEIWDDAVLYVSPDDPGALEQAILYLADNPALRADLAIRAWNRALMYTSKKMASQYLSLTKIYPAPRLQCRVVD